MTDASHLTPEQKLKAIETYLQGQDQTAALTAIHMLVLEDKLS